MVITYVYKILISRDDFAISGLLLAKGLLYAICKLGVVLKPEQVYTCTRRKMNFCGYQCIMANQLFD